MYRKLIAAIIVAVAVTSCGTNRREQLQRVAKDWCETIRASQVIAVYPLTEDIQPGDVFLVQTPIDKQQDAYKQDGFLPLDNHLARLDPGQYVPFYDHSFLEQNAQPILPKDWMKSAWEAAPAAAFPTYAFSATQAGGLNLALPVSGVPVGLSILGTKSANGSISLKDARTIGVDGESLYHQLKRWSLANKERRRLLANFGVEPGESARNYLRVVTRVYLLGAIDVQLNDARSFGAGADAGAPRPVELFVPMTPTGTDDTMRAGQENYLRGLQRLNAMGGLGGASSGGPIDPSLSNAELAQRLAARKQAEDEQLAKAKADDEASRKELEKALAEGESDRKAIAADEAALAEARKKLAARKDALAQLEAQEPRDEVAIKTAKDEVDVAEKDVKDKDDALTAKKDAYAKGKGKTVQDAAGKADVAASALRRLESLAPGGSFRFSAASTRSVSMTETFESPLVVGYLGFDVPIGVDGELGPPIPTYSRLQDSIDGQVIFEGGDAAIYETAALASLYGAIETSAAADDREAGAIKADVDGMARFMPAMAYRHRDDEIKIYEPGRYDFAGYLAYRDERSRVISKLDQTLADKGSLKVADKVKTTEEIRRLVDRLRPSPEEDQAFKRATRRLQRFWVSR
ncbi:MAG: hypothetical protein H6807_11460 [Planctomycetes bacterium]|nr:hypothetical protein [Planctomycetota bacterium]